VMVIDCGAAARPTSSAEKVKLADDAVATGVPVGDCANAHTGAIKRAPTTNRIFLRNMVPSKGIEKVDESLSYALEKRSARRSLPRRKIDYPPAPRHAARSAIILPLSRVFP